jgi:ATP-dependent 26S proteasome regulatory subunit
VLRRRRAEARLPERGWEELILPAETVSQLKSLARLIADPEAGREFGVTPPSGALLAGPPGTGKTTIAQVLASQLRGEVAFLPAKGSDLVSKYVGESAVRVRDLFDRARAQPPAIIFIDEIDALLPTRGGDSEREGILTEFLQQLDGLDSTPGVFVLGATNLPERIDPAVTRPGRLGRRIDIPLPDLAGRRALIGLHSARLHLDSGVDLGELAAATEGASGAGIEGICNDAAEHAFFREAGPRRVTAADFAVALQRWRTAAQGHATLATW